MLRRRIVFSRHFERSEKSLFDRTVLARSVIVEQGPYRHA